MNRPPKPHVSPALAQLRSGVTLACLGVAVAVLIQLLVFGFVHFTDLRYEGRQAQPSTQQPLSVVPGVAVGPRSPVAAPPSAAPPAPTPAVAEPRTLSALDSVFRRSSDLAATLGLASTGVLWVLVFLGVVVAAGGQVPGVDKAVSAAVWSIVLAAACLPWGRMTESTPIPGVFTGYASLTAASEAASTGAGSLVGLLAAHLILPIAVFFIALLVLARFREGIAAGIIIRSVSELDEAIEREAEEIARRGVTISGPRTVGALNAAMGAPAVTHAPEPHEPEAEPTERAYVPRAAAIAAAARSESLPRPAPVRERRASPAEHGETYRRPI